MNNIPPSIVSHALAFLCMLCAVNASDPPLAPAEPRNSVTLYVSKLGDNSDGSSWRKAFQTIQSALNAVPDARGGHHIVIRPDTYDEANLYPPYAGAPDAYNVIEGDWDGRLGSGATGWVVVDSGAPRVIVRTNPKARRGIPPS